MKATILRQPPPSGNYEEYNFQALGDCTWVLFSSIDSEDWVGVFGRGELGRDDVTVSQDNYACILAGGVAYVISVSDRSLLYQPKENQLQGVAAVPGRELFIAHDYIQLFAYDSSGPKWSSSRISLDGIDIESVNSDQLKGKVWTGELWKPFTLEFDGWQFQCEWQCPC